MPLGQALATGWVLSPPPLNLGGFAGFAQSKEKLEACLVLPSYNILFNMVCPYQQTVSIHFGRLTEVRAFLLIFFFPFNTIQIHRPVEMLRGMDSGV